MRTLYVRLGSLVPVMLGLFGCEGSGPTASPAGSTAPSGAPSASGAASAKAEPAAPKNTTVNAFLKKGTPTFVRGTAGDDFADRAVVAQVELIRQLFPKAKVVDDATIDAAKGVAAWPENPIVYGGPHVNHLLAKLDLPFEMSAGKLKLGGKTYDGESYRVMAVVPARAASDDGPGHPEFLLYAGTGTPGIEEINSVSHGPETILVADEFGKLVVGKWFVGPSGSVEATMQGETARRIAWREETRELTHGGDGDPGEVKFMFPKQLPAADDESKTIDACMRGLETAVKKLSITEPPSATVYVHPDRGSKKTLTGNEGDGHAVLVSDVLHVIRFDPPALEKLMAHEGTHVLGHRAWGPASTPLMGEGLAVWVSGYYAGKSLAEHAKAIGEAPRIVELLKTGAFRKMPEAETYPVAGLLVDVMMKEIGADNVRDHLLGATADSWQEDCEAAGTTPAALQDALGGKLN